MAKPLIKIGGQQISVKSGSGTPPARSEPVAVAPKPKRRREDRRIRSTSFSLEDPIEKKLSEHADRFSCFSTYVKRLIQRDMESSW